MEKLEDSRKVIDQQVSQKLQAERAKLKQEASRIQTKI
jgi:hypothetical protein